MRPIEIDDAQVFAALEIRCDDLERHAVELVHSLHRHLVGDELVDALVAQLADQALVGHLLVEVPDAFVARVPNPGGVLCIRGGAVVVVEVVVVVVVVVVVTVVVTSPSSLSS